MCLFEFLDLRSLVSDLTYLFGGPCPSLVGESEDTRQSWPKLSAAMMEHFRTEVECENVHQLVANLGQLEGESVRRYVDRVTKLVDRLTAMQPDNEVFQEGMTTYIVELLDQWSIR